MPDSYMMWHIQDHSIQYFAVVCIKVSQANHQAIQYLRINMCAFKWIYSTIKIGIATNFYMPWIILIVTSSVHATVCLFPRFTRSVTIIRFQNPLLMTWDNFKVFMLCTDIVVNIPKTIMCYWLLINNKQIFLPQLLFFCVYLNVYNFIYVFISLYADIIIFVFKYIFSQSLYMCCALLWFCAPSAAKNKMITNYF